MVRSFFPGPKWGQAVNLRFLPFLILGLALGCAGTQKKFSQHEQIKEALSVYETGLILEMENNDAGARAAYEQSIKVSPRPIVHYRLGVVLARLGEYDPALENLNQALELVPSLTIAEKEKVRVEALIKMRESGLKPVLPDQETPSLAPPVIQESELPEEEVIGSESEAPSESLSSEITTPPAGEEESQETSAVVEQTRTRAYEMAQRGELEGAIQLYQETLLNTPDDPRLYYNLGHLYQQQGKLQKAYLKYQRALDLQPEYGLAWNNLGYVLERLSRSDEALECYLQAIVSGHVLEAYFNSALLLEKKGDMDSSLDQFRIFLERGGGGKPGDIAREHIKRLERRF